METTIIEELTVKIKDLLTEKDYREIKQILVDIHPADIADFFEELTSDEAIILFRLLPKALAAEVFTHLNPQIRKNIVSVIHDSQMTSIFNEMYFDDRIDFLEEMPANFVRNLIETSPPDERKLINQFLNYPENSAGSLMTIEFMELQKSMTVQQALTRIRRTGQDSETIYTCYVLNDTRKLEGTVSLRRLVLSEESQIIDEILKQDTIKVLVSDDQEQIAELFKRYDLISVPVVDSEDRLIGIITIDDIMDVVEQEATEDFQKMAALSPSEEAYLDTSVFRLAHKRIVWLFVLMISATFTGGIILRYEALLDAAIVLATFIPMLMDSGGNAGSQSSTLIIRGIALGDIKLTDWPKVLWKEFRVSLIVGAAMSSVNIVRMMIMKNTFGVSLTVSLTLLCVIVIAKLVGSLLPIAAKALKLDPAIMAGPLITTIVDALALIIYFSLASAILSL